MSKYQAKRPEDDEPIGDDPTETPPPVKEPEDDPPATTKPAEKLADGAFEVRAPNGG